MRTRTARNGREQVLLGVWVDEAVYAELERLAKSRGTTIAEITRTLLERSVQAESDRPNAEQIVQSLLDLSEAERESLRQQLASGVKRRVLPGGRN